MVAAVVREWIGVGVVYEVELVMEGIGRDWKIGAWTCMSRVE